MRQWPCEIPIDGKPRDVHEAVAAYSRWLQETDLPKLFCYARPGALCTRPTVEWVQESFQNLTAIDVGKGLHFIQEDNPHGIGEALADWYRGL